MARTALTRELLSKMKERYGPKSGGSGATTGNRSRRVPIGPLDLDYALGGGCHDGLVHSLYGAKSGGKTTTSLKIVAVHQGLCRNCLRPAKNVQSIEPIEKELEDDPDIRWEASGECDCFALGIYKPDVPEFRDEKGKKIASNTKKYKEYLEEWQEGLRANSYEEYVVSWMDLEMSFSERYARMQGVAPERLLLFRGTSAEAAGDFLHAIACTNEVDMLVIDSIAQMAPNKEIESSMEDWQQGLHARLMNKLGRLLVRDATNAAVNKRSITQIWINQTREKIGVMFGDPTTKPGGKGQEFAAHIEIKFLGSKRETEKVQYGTKDEFDTVPVSETFRFSVTKNKGRGTNGVGGSYTQRTRSTASGPAGSLIEEEDLLKRALHYLVDQDPKTKQYRLGDEEFSSRKAILNRIIEDLEFRAALKKALLDTMLEGVA